MLEIAHTGQFWQNMGNGRFCKPSVTFRSDHYGRELFF